MTSSGRTWTKMGLSVMVAVLVTVLGALIGLLAWALVQAFLGILSWSAEIGTAIIGAIATVMGSVLTLVLSRRWERQRATEQEIRMRKLPIYEAFVGFWVTVFMSGSPGLRRVSKKEAGEFDTSFSQQLMMWGADDVLHQYTLFRQAVAGSSSSYSSTDVKWAFRRLWLLMRADVGHNNSGLEHVDVLSMLGSDVSKAVGLLGP